jgi:hypothetical protein
MPVGALDRSVFVGDARIVPGRRHAVMGTQFFVPAGQVVLCVAIEVAERRRQTIGAALA